MEESPIVERSFDEDAGLDPAEAIGNVNLESDHIVHHHHDDKEEDLLTYVTFKTESRFHEI